VDVNVRNDLFADAQAAAQRSVSNAPETIPARTDCGA